jgi:hypothetical protein
MQMRAKDPKAEDWRPGPNEGFIYDGVKYIRLRLCVHGNFKEFLDAQGYRFLALSENGVLVAFDETCAGKYIKQPMLFESD